MCILSAIFCIPLIALASIGFKHTSGVHSHSTSHTCLGIQMFVAFGAALSAISASSISENPENDTLSQSETECIKKKLSIKSIIIISTIQLIFALVTVITEMIIINNYDIPSLTGIWTGFLFALSGLTGLLAAQKPSKHKYVYKVDSCDSGFAHSRKISTITSGSIIMGPKHARIDNPSAQRVDCVITISIFNI